MLNALTISLATIAAEPPATSLELEYLPGQHMVIDFTAGMLCLSDGDAWVCIGGPDELIDGPGVAPNAPFPTSPQRLNVHWLCLNHVYNVDPFCEPNFWDAGCQRIYNACIANGGPPSE